MMLTVIILILNTLCNLHMLYIACIQIQASGIFWLWETQNEFFCAPKDYNLSLDLPTVIASYENSLN